MVSLAQSTFAQNELPGDTCNPSRQVTTIAAELWKRNYLYLRENNFMQHNNGIKHIEYFSRQTITDALGLNAISTSLILRYYMKNRDSIPRLALTSTVDTTKYVIYDRGRNSIISHDSLRSGFNEWANFIARDSNFLTITSYSICFDDVNSMFETNTDSLAVRNVAKLILSSNDRYAYPDISYEGLLALDVLLAPKDDAIISDNYNRLDLSEFYNFAAPCPKNCIGFMQRPENTTP
jgi:hypothetical protein